MAGGEATFLGAGLPIDSLPKRSVNANNDVGRIADALERIAKALEGLRADEMLAAYSALAKREPTS